MDVKTETVPLGPHNLPPHPVWETDGACWKAIVCDPATQGCDWRWQPLNWTAFAKAGPEGEMSDIPPDTWAHGFWTPLPGC